MRSRLLGSSQTKTRGDGCVRRVFGCADGGDCVEDEAHVVQVFGCVGSLGEEPGDVWTGAVWVRCVAAGSVLAALAAGVHEEVGEPGCGPPQPFKGFAASAPVPEVFDDYTSGGGVGGVGEPPADGVAVGAGEGDVVNTDGVGESVYGVADTVGVGRWASWSSQKVRIVAVVGMFSPQRGGLMVDARGGLAGGWCGYGAGGGAVEPRTMSSVERSRWGTRTVPPSARVRSMSVAVSPMRLRDWSMVVSGGDNHSVSWTPS